MKNKNLILLKTLLLSTSQRNIYKNTKDKKKRRKIVGNTIGAILVYVMIMIYSMMMCLGYGFEGMIEAAPVMCALIVSTLSFVFTFFKTNGYLFNFKEYDMLMSLPFESSSVAGCKFMYMYIKSLPWYLSISLAMMAGYGIFAGLSLLVLLMWIILSFILPVIPMLLASFLGFLIARISTGFRKTNIIQTILTFIFVIFCFSLRYIIEAVFRDDQAQATLEKTSEITAKAGRIYLPAGWFSDAITKGSVLPALLLISLSVLLFAVLFYVVGRSYRNINSALKNHAAARKYKMAGQKKRSVVNTLAYKEFKRILGSTTCTVNGLMGELLALLFSVVTLVVGFDKIVAIITQNAPFDPAILRPAIPFIVYFLIGMMSTTAFTPSLEGKNYWIVQSLPITKKSLYQGKMLFNMYVSVPFMAISTLCLCISAGVPVVETILYLVLGFVLCCFSTAYGCVCGIKHMRLDWENEVEVVKQGAAVAVYMLPNMFVVMGLTALVIFLGIGMDHILLAVIFILIAGVMAAFCYLRAMALANRT